MATTTPRTTLSPPEPPPPPSLSSSTLTIPTSMTIATSTTSSSSRENLSWNPLEACRTTIVGGFKAVQSYIVDSMNRFFYNHGKRVASHPYWYIVICLVITGLCSVGLMKFREENNIIKLWIPEDSSQRVNTDWLWSNFPDERRYASMIFVADNILVPEVIQSMYRVHKDIEAIVSEDGATWADTCVRVPIVKPPKLSAVLFGDEDEDENNAETEAPETRRKRSPEQPEVLKINADDEIDELDAPLFPDSKNIFGQQTNGATAENKFFEIKNSSEIDEGSSSSEDRFEATEWTTQSYYFNDFDSFNQNDTEEYDYNETSDKALYNSLNLYPDPYCESVAKIPMVCLEWSILELWGSDGTYDEITDEEIATLTQQSILDKINDVTKSGIFLHHKNFLNYLGQISYDENGKIIGAKATVMRWFGTLNSTATLLNPVRFRDEPIDHRTYNFEGEMIKVMLNTSGYPEGLESYPNVQRSFGDVAFSTIFGDISFLAIGFAIVLIYIIVMLGKFSWVENRFYLSGVGIICVVMGVLVAYGFCSAVGLFFGPMHNILPLLLLGIGIDDMFVIVQSWETLTEKERREKPLVERFGIVMMHSGVAITITSITDVAAFALGATTILPALKSFCLFASVGIIAIYWFICTFFVAFMYIDQIRLESNRDGFWPCYKHKKVASNFFTEKGLSKLIFDIYGNFLMKTPVKVAVILFTATLTGVGIWGNCLIEQKFVPAWFLPPDSYLSRWFKINEQYFPFGGDRVTVWYAGLDYVGEMEQIHNLAVTLSNQTDIIDNVDSWTTKYLEYIQLPSYSLSSWDGDYRQFGNDSYFYHKLTQFLFSPYGAKYRPQFKFEFDPWCGYTAPNIYMTDISFTHKIFSGPSEHIPAMNRVKKIIADANLTGNVFPLSQGYAAWETDEVITYELYRNLGLAILCIFVTTMILVGHLICSLLVLSMVVLSLIDVAGFIHFWGLTIDTVSCVNLIIAIGLCVDYSAHVAHRFLVERSGSREDRVRTTLIHIGPAVLNGGVSTFIAFILLGPIL